MEPGPDVAGLYGLDLPAFTAARDALAKQLRSAGERVEADAVKKLRRPSLTAWALNQAARRRPDLVAAALDARAQLGAATRQAIEGDPSALRQAQLDERRAVDEVVSVAADILAGAGHAAADAARMRMADTVRAASLDDGVASGLRHGVLDRDHQATGFGIEGNVAAPASPPRPGPSEPRPAPRDTAEPPPGSDDLARQRAKRLAAELAGEAEDKARRAGRLQDAAARAESDADKARQAADLADRNAAEARRAADQAEQRAAGARQHAVDAELRAAGARENRDSAERDAAEARRRADEAGS